MDKVRIPSVDDLNQVPLYSDGLRHELGELLNKLELVERELSTLDETSRVALTAYLTEYRERAESMRGAYGAPRNARAVGGKLAELAQELNGLIDRAVEEAGG